MMTIQDQRMNTIEQAAAECNGWPGLTYPRSPVAGISCELDAMAGSLNREQSGKKAGNNAAAPGPCGAPRFNNPWRQAEHDPRV
jgi:hypothetical protein